MAQLAKKIALPEVAPEPLEQALETAEIAPPAQPGLPFLCFSKDNFVLLDQKGAIHIVPKVSDFEKKTFRLVVTGARDLNGDLPTALIESRFPKAVRDRVSFLERQGASYGWRMDEHLEFNFREGVGASFPSED
ncbi:MAG: hypothetical protein KDD64_12510, partial [Bdellovibrionales bacterium]|nr:hypothetical protein [Bdellovibrionales bacterium]